jgi:hypothetical protein
MHDRTPACGNVCCASQARAGGFGASRGRARGIRIIRGRAACSIDFIGSLFFKKKKIIIEVFFKKEVAWENAVKIQKWSGKTKNAIISSKNQFRLWEIVMDLYSACKGGVGGGGKLFH